MSCAKLEAKVKAVNLANAMANELYPVLREALRPFIGMQVMKKGGGLLERVKKALPELPNKPFLQVFRNTSDYSLGWTIKTCEMIGDTHGCLYHEITVYVGSLHNDVLTGFEVDWTTARTDYTAEEVEAKRMQFLAARRLADEARNNLYPFGEYDN